MIRGIGVDICAVHRMKEWLDKPTYLMRLFTEREIAYIKAKGAVAAQSCAALFAAKEAFFKALGFGIGKLDFTDVEIRHSPLGAPFIVLSDNAKRKLSDVSIANIHLSVSHEGDMAVAMVVVEAEQ